MIFDRNKYKNFARIQLLNRMKVPMLITIISLVITLIINIPTRFLPDITADLQKYELSFIQENLKVYLQAFGITALISIIQLIASSILSLARNKVFLKMAMGPDQVEFNVFVDGLKNWKKAVATGLWRFLWLFLWGYPVLFATIAISTFLFFYSKIPVTVISICIIASMVPMIIKNIEYSMAMYFATEYEKVNFRKALSLSKIITKNHKMDLFMMELSFIVSYLLVIITAGFALAFVLPYIELTEINAYHALLKDAVDSGNISFEELGIEAEIISTEPQEQLLIDSDENE